MRVFLGAGGPLGDPNGNFKVIFAFSFDYEGGWYALETAVFVGERKWPIFVVLLF